MENKLVKYYQDKFRKDNYKFIVLMGFIIIISFLSLMSSFILLFWFDWWWKLTVSSAGLIWCSIQIIENKCQTWIDKQ